MRRALTCLAAALLLTACSGGDDDPGRRGAGGPTASPVVPTDKPTVTVPSGPPPTRLVQDDLRVGTGAAVLPGQVASVRYVGVEYDTGEQFDSSWDDGGHPFQFVVGDDTVIEGWDKGILGMRVGGRRRLVIPPELAYGTAPGHPLAGKTLVFVIDLVAAGGGQPAGDPFSPGG